MAEKPHGYPTMDAAAETYRLRVLRSMRPEDRLAQALELSELTRRLLGAR